MKQPKPATPINQAAPREIKHGPKDEWTMSHRVKVGNEFDLACHRVRVAEVLDHSDPMFCRARVVVLGPIINKTTGEAKGPALSVTGEIYDTDGAFVSLEV